MKRLIALLLTLMVVGCAVPVEQKEAQVEQDVPALDENLKYVQDHAKLFSDSERVKLNHVLTVFEESTSVEIFVVTTNVPEVSDMAQFTQRIFNQWKPGKKELNNGIIIHLNVGKYKDIQINTGYGIEADLPDITCGHIIDFKMVDLIRAGKYQEALVAGADSVCAALGTKAWTQRMAHRDEVKKQQQIEAAEAFHVLVIVVLVFAFVGGIAAAILIPISRKRRKELLRSQTIELLAQLAGFIEDTPRKITGAESALGLLRERYPESAWREFFGLGGKVRAYCINFKTLRERAEILLQSGVWKDIKKAAAIAEDARISALAAVDLVNGPSQRLCNLDKAEETVPELCTKTAKAIETAKDVVCKTGVSPAARQYLDEAIRKLTQAKKLQTGLIDWLLVSSLVNEATDLMGKALQQADEDLNPHRSRFSSSSSGGYTSRHSNDHGSSNTGFHAGGGRSGGGGAGRRI
jgi:uncharacterized membrane protein YgcG